MPSDKIKMNTVSEIVKKNFTNEYILLGILMLAVKQGCSLQRMQIMKILQKVKMSVQDNLQLEAYHNEFVKEKHGDFDPNIYEYLTDLKQADLITSEGVEPLEHFIATPLGEEIFNSIEFSTGEDNKKATLVKDILSKVISSEAHKSSEELRKENHEREILCEGKKIKMDDVEKGIVTTLNINSAEKFLFDDRAALDWSLHKKIAIRKRERVVPDSEMPQGQEDVYNFLKLA